VNRYHPNKPASRRRSSTSRAPILKWGTWGAKLPPIFVARVNFSLLFFITIKRNRR